jgi:hypothetical protein
MRAMNKIELRPGDIILSLGKRDLSKGIMNVAGGRYSHAGLWTGKRVIESTLPKVHAISPQTLAKKTVYADAFRHRDAGGKEKQLIRHAQRLVGNPYCRLDLVVACAIGTFTAWVRSKNEWLAYNTQYEAGRARLLLSQLVSLYRVATKPTVTCVELVVRAHIRAGLPVKVKLDPGGHVDFKLLWRAIKDLYALNKQTAHVLETDMSGRELLKSLKADLDWAEDIHGRVRQAIRPKGARFPTSALDTSVSVLEQIELFASETWDNGRSWYAGLVTPKQLENSPSLKPLGRLTGQWWLEASAKRRKPINASFS